VSGLLIEGAPSAASAPPVTTATTTTDCPACLADFAIYDPEHEDDGVWEEEVAALRALLEAFDWSYLVVDDDTINGAIDPAEKRVKALLGPGGWAARRNEDVTGSGDAAIRAFIDAGGNYIGFCAGAYWVSDEIAFSRYAWHGYVRPWMYFEYGDAEGYDLDLWPGSARGPFGWTPWRAGSNPTLEPAAIALENPTMAAIEIPPITRFFYFGGPVFRGLDPPPPGVEVWARAIAPADAPPAGRSGEGEATIIHFPRGLGNVTLFSYHPDILIGSLLDGVELSTYFDETAIGWDLGEQTLEEINLQSWNVVHAALQIAIGEAVTPVRELPGR
jgi:glutamine amidotransferase-like uncharacterized protein